MHVARHNVHGIDTVYVHAVHICGYTPIKNSYVHYIEIGSRAPTSQMQPRITYFHFTLNDKFCYFFKETILFENVVIIMQQISSLCVCSLNWVRESFEF